jgi:threonylcarbamoyladenosine tRNA methylthiotransferase CDKAL1
MAQRFLFAIGVIWLYFDQNYFLEALAMSSDIEDLGASVRPVRPPILIEDDEDNEEAGYNALITRRAASPSHQAAASSGVPGTATVYVRTWGCGHNASDGEVMAGLLSREGYTLTDRLLPSCDVAVLNSCTVKGPSEDAFRKEVDRARAMGVKVVVAGCVPQGDPKAWEDVSVLGVQQIDRVGEVVEETLRGNVARLLGTKSLVSLDLPKVRKNRFVEIIPINVGCLNACTYCKTRSARGKLKSYPVEQIVARALDAVRDGVTEIRLTSEDTGAYGIDLGTTLPDLLEALVASLPGDGSVMLKVGMTNPPYILNHLERLAALFRHPSVFATLHVPIQSGSDQVLRDMRREYTVADFEAVHSYLTAHVPGIQIATDIICGFPTEREADFALTMDLVARLRFPSLHITAFYPRPGTPAASMRPQVKDSEKRDRTRRLTALFDSYQTHEALVGSRERVWINEMAADGVHYAGHTKTYVQVLIDCKPGEPSLLGKVRTALITRAIKFAVFGEIVEDDEVEDKRGLLERAKGWLLGK